MYNQLWEVIYGNGMGATIIILYWEWYGHFFSSSHTKPMLTPNIHVLTWVWYGIKTSAHIAMEIVWVQQLSYDIGNGMGTCFYPIPNPC
jgi:hypothetical protein